MARGIVAGPSASGPARINYPDGITMQVPLSPHRGGWVRDGSTTAEMATSYGTPPYIHPSTTSFALQLISPLDFLFNSSDGKSSTLYYIDSIDVSYYRNASGDTITLALNRHDRAVGTANTVISSFTHSSNFTVTGGTWTDVNLSIGHNVVVSNDYWFNLILQASGAAADCRIGRVTLNVTRFGVE